MTERQANADAADLVARKGVAAASPLPLHAASSLLGVAGRAGKSPARRRAPLLAARSSSAGRRQSGTKFFRCQLWTVVAGMPVASATTT